MTIRILVVDDFEQWRLAVRSMLELIPCFRVIGEASDGEEAAELSLRNSAPVLAAG
jgi:DNA-binding NarL/FixJ family response regulator